MVVFILIVLGVVPSWSADIIIDIPDPLVSRVVDGICGTYDYDVAKQNGETKAQFSQRMVKKIIRQTVIAYESTAVKQTARQNADTAITQINSEVSF